jgi:DNA-binding beta-propeller fold protein YncE
VVGQRGLYVGNFSRPKGIALDSDGNVYVSESYYDYLLIYNQQGELLMSIGGSGPSAGQFSQPTGIWVDDRDRVFVSDMLNGRISMFQYLGSN